MTRYGRPIADPDTRGQRGIPLQSACLVFSWFAIVAGAAGLILHGLGLVGVGVVFTGPAPGFGAAAIWVADAVVFGAGLNNYVRHKLTRFLTTAIHVPDAPPPPRKPNLLKNKAPREACRNLQQCNLTPAGGWG